MNTVTIRSVTKTDTEAYQQIYNLREIVLRQPIGLSLDDEDLSADEEDTIVIAEVNDDVIACLMLHPSADPHVIKFRQMAVDESFQGKGIGQLLMTNAEQLCLGKGYNKITLHARVTAQPFYEKLGYVTTSDVFTEVGIPHVVMEKTLPDAV